MSIREAVKMPDACREPEVCNCLALRQAARHVTSFYEGFMAPTGLRISQFSILVRLRRKGPMTINALAAELLLDRTTLARNLLPLRREGLVAIARGKADRRSREVRLTDSGLARMRAGIKRWAAAQKEFEARFGSRQSAKLRHLMHAVATSDLGIPAGASA